MSLYSYKVYTVSVVPMYVLKFIGWAADDTWKYSIVALICEMAKVIVRLALIRMNNSLRTALGLNQDGLPCYLQDLERLKLMITHSL